MRIFLPAIAAFSLIANVAIADDPLPTANQAPLPPGGAAGVHNAQIVGDPTYWWVGLGIVALGVGIAFALTSNHHHHNSTTSTTTTSTKP